MENEYSIVLTLNTAHCLDFIQHSVETEYTAVNIIAILPCCLCVVSSDLYGLLLFLAVDPYWMKFWWNKLLFEPFNSGVKQPLYDAVSEVLWRTAKDDFIEQVSGVVCCCLSLRLM